MAEFDPIEFFGIGLGRDIAIARHARTRSQTPINLPSPSCVHASLDKSIPQWTWHTPIQRSAFTRAPRSPSHLFVDITPEDSVFGPTFGLPTSSAASPNVSEDSSWTHDAAEPSSLERYLRSHERHEEIALAMPLAPGEFRTVPAEEPADDVYSLLDSDTTLPGDSPPNTDAPIHRYLADVQPHERLAVDLEEFDQGQSQMHAKSSDHNPQKAASSISLSDGSEMKEEGDDVVMMVKMAHQEIRGRRRERALSLPRRHKAIRKRRGGSPQQGHRYKMAKLC